jgi:hypothetical protein
MSAVEKIKLAAAELGPDEHYELFRWWTESDAFRKRQLTALQKDITSGLDDLKAERFKAYDDTNIMQLAEDIGRTGRECRKNPGK